MQTPFDQKVRELQATTSYHHFAYTPEESVEELAGIARNLHVALARIAYPDHWPRVRTLDDIPREPQELANWMQSVAANALTNYRDSESALTSVQPDGPDAADPYEYAERNLGAECSE